MKAVVYRGPKQVAVADIENPRIEKPTDAILRITSAGLCGSDLHIYDGRENFEQGRSIGHEIMGVIEEVGSSVTQIKAGDRVVLPFNVACGTCTYCSQGLTNACLTVNPEGAGGGYGYPALGPFQGGQAEYITVPFADFNCLKLPGTPGDEFEDDFLLLSDIFPTAYHATELAMVKTGSSVAIFGAGPVGLLAALSCKIKGASEIYVVDSVPTRLEKARQIGATAIDETAGDPVQQIMQHRKNNPLIQAAMRPGDEKLTGVMCGIDAVGFQAHSDPQPNVEKANQVIQDLVKLVNPGGHLGIIGAFTPSDIGAKDPNAKQGEFVIPWGEIWEKGLTIGTGQCPVKKYNVHLRDLIIAGYAKPSVIVSHHQPLSAAPDAYQKFDQRAEGYTKVIFNPAKAA